MAAVSYLSYAKKFTRELRTNLSVAFNRLNEILKIYVKKLASENR